MVMLNDLADACRKSGLRVVERPRWRNRGHGGMSGIECIVVHHTGGPSSGEAPSLNYIEDRGLSQLVLGRSGTVYVTAAGKCWHAGVVHERWQGNSYAIGIEAEHDGRQDWTDTQYQAYVRLVRALCDHYRVPVSRVLGHKEVARPTGRKVDPTFHMTQFRRDVAALEEDDVRPEDFDRIRDIVRQESYNAARIAVHALLDEAAERSTPTGRQVGDDLIALIRQAKPEDTQ